jgi:hypothetical protein
MNEAAIRRSFLEQATFCEKLGSPFTARLLVALEGLLDATTPIGAAVLGWPGDPTALGDALALRLAGALQSLVLKGEASADVQALYPPHTLPEVGVMRPALNAALERHAPAILDALRFSPQTNETTRLGVLFPGLLTIARMTGSRLALFEIGASAGLNLCLDRFAYQFGDRTYGAPVAEPLIAPEWQGEMVDGPMPDIVSRRGCDLNPLRIRDPQHRLRLRSFIWPDQPLRIDRFEAAVRTALATEFTLDQADAAAWVEGNVAIAEEAGVCPVLLHSIAFQYFPEQTQQRIAAHMDRLGAAATKTKPIAWLAFEQLGNRGAHLVLRLWPGGEYRVLARAGAHVPKVIWFGETSTQAATLEAVMASLP